MSTQPTAVPVHAGASGFSVEILHLQAPEVASGLILKALASV
jgi:hypothetical protein